MIKASKGAPHLRLKKQCCATNISYMKYIKDEKSMFFGEKCFTQELFSSGLFWVSPSEKVSRNVYVNSSAKGVHGGFPKLHLFWILAH